MLVKTYFERLYTHMREELYYPNRKNSGIFVVRCFYAAGSNYFPFKKGKRYTSRMYRCRENFMMAVEL